MAFQADVNTPVSARIRRVASREIFQKSIPKSFKNIYPEILLLKTTYTARLCRFQRAAHLNSSQQGRRPNFFILLLGAKNKIKISLFYFSCNFNPNFSNRFFNCCLLASCCKRSLISACSCFILVPKSICSSRLPQTALAIVEGPAQLLTRRRPYPSQRGSLPARRALPHSQPFLTALHPAPKGVTSVREPIRCCPSFL